MSNDMGSKPQSAPRTLAVVFSKDRPLQLDGLLESLRMNRDDVGSAELHVLYKASTPAFAAAYRRLGNEHRNVVLHREVDFKADLIGIVGGADHVLFLVDDTLFLGPLSLAATVEVLERDPTCLGFSFRLGRNTKYCYTLDKPQRVPAFEELGSGLFTFDWTLGEHDFGYPLEVSSSLYRCSDLLPVLRDLDFENPNTLEARLAESAVRFQLSRPRLACYERSVAVSIPANLVQTAWVNRVNGRPDLSTDALAARYDEGERLDTERYQGLIATACHQELDFAYRRTSSPTVSIIIPCFRQAQYLAEAVGSIVSQTSRDWEVIIIDDGSPDETAQIATDLITRYPGERIALLRQPNMGLAEARNAGVRATRGRYILPLDADDMLEPEMVERTVQVLSRDPSIAIAYTDLQRFGGGAELIRAAEFDPSRLPETNQLNYCSLYRQEVWDAVGGYNPNMTSGYEDWDFWVGAAERGYRARRLPEALFRYRIRGNSMYSTALRHDAELTRQLRLNHPATYRIWRRLFRWLKVRPMDASRRVRRRVGRAVHTASTYFRT